MSKHTAKMNEKIMQFETIMVENFKYLHQNPELSFQEFQTTQYIKDTLTNLGIKIIDCGMETGVIALLEGGAPGPCIGLRADIDALPIQEATNCPFKSKIDNVMHACGHDTHMGSLLGAARVLASMKDDIRGSVKFFFQHAEERNQGAKEIIRRGGLKNPDVDIVFGMHNQPEISVGQIGVKNGELMAAVDRFYITVHGKGGHGGVPHRNRDTVVASAAIIQSLQSIVSRNVNPKDACVISICSVHGGSGLTFNVIPEELQMAGTTRSYDKELGANLENMMRRVIMNTAVAYEVTAELEYIYDQPAVINPADIYETALRSVEDVQTSMGQITSVDPIPSTGGEDFTFFMQEIPAFFYWLGVGNPELECIYPWHSPHFRADERCIPIGAGVYASSVFNAIEAIENTKIRLWRK